MDSSHPLLPGPRLSNDFSSPPFPPGFRRWSGQAPISQSRGGYISPDPSPTSDEMFFPPDAPARPMSQPGCPSHDFAQNVHDMHLHARSHQPIGLNFYKAPPSGPEMDPYYYPIVPRQPSVTQGRKKSTRKVDGKQPTFLTKLYQILDQPEYGHIIRWDEAGEVVVIEKPDELADKILPLVYRQSRFASFSRQLNIYGFMRKVSLRHVDRGICDPDASTWSHPFLRRSSSAADIQGFKRRVPPRPSQASKRRASASSMYQDDLPMGLSPTSSEGSYASPPDPYQHHLLPDVDEEKPTTFAAGQYMGIPFGSRSSPESFANNQNRPIHPAFMADNRHSQTNTLPTMIPTYLQTSFPDQCAAPGLIPASAPAHLSAFPMGMHRISQGHIRTRSVQGEPPSATLFSPTSPLAQSSWGHTDTEMRDASLPAVFQTTAESHWSKREGTTIPSNTVIAAPAQRQPQAASLPSHFAHPGSIDTRASLEGPAPTTVSPGIYQAGFAPPTHRNSYAPTTPRAMSSRQERRSSLTSSPYSTRPREATSSHSVGPIRHFIDRRSSAEASHDSRIDEEALPSAGVTGLHRGPFEGVLPGA